MVLETITKNDGKQTPQIIPFSLGTITISACYGWDGHAWDITYEGVTKRLHLAEVLSFPGFTIKVLSDGGWCTSVSPATFQIATSTTGFLPSSAAFIINTQKNLKGTVEKRTDYLLWHITSPIIKDIPYGNPDVIPATWIDGSGNEQMAVIKTNAWGANDVALDHDLSGGYAEKYVLDSEVDIITQKAGYTTQIRYPGTGKKPSSDSNLIIWVIGAAVIAIALFGGKK